MENTETTRVSGVLGWLEEEQHQTKAQLGRFQYQIEQLVNLTREQSGQIRANQEELAAARNQLSKFSVLDDMIRQIRENLARLQSSHNEHLAEEEKEDRAWRGELDKTKQAVGEMWGRIDAVYREFEPLLGKAQGIGDTVKRHQDAIGELARGVGGLQQESQTLTVKVQIAAEQGKRNDSELERLNRQIDTLRQQDEVTLGRLQVLADKVKQVDEQIDAVLSEEQLKVDLNERIQVLRLEQQRLDRQLVDIAPLVDIHSVRLDEQAREIRQVEDRRRLTADDIGALRQLLQEHVARLEGYIINVDELAERHKRRQVSELEHEANELKLRIAKLKGQV